MPPALQTLDDTLQDLRAGACRPAEFSAAARGQQALLASLPPRYAQVLMDLLDRLESSALFAEESCSFSQQDLLDGLQQWIVQASRQLNSSEPSNRGADIP